jgi:hypothetical protein
MNQDQLDAIAREIRRYYLERKNSLYNKTFKLTGSNAEFIHWQKAAAVCVELNATPEVFVDAAFSNCRSTFGPFPNAMYGSACRGWYREYSSSRKNYNQAKQQAAQDGKDAMFDADTDTYTLDLKYEIELAERSLIRLTGTKKINDITIEYINSLTTSYPAHVRVLLGYKNDKVKLFFGPAALEFYNTRPHMYRAAQNLGYPIKDILLWLNVQNH